MPLPPSPLKLAHRNPSMIDESPISPGTGVNGFAPQSPLEPQTPRLSAPPSPVTPRQNLHTMAGSQRESVDFSADAGGGGLGNLADELADAWEQEDEGYGYASGQETGAAESQPMDHSDGEDAYMQSVRDMRTQSPSADSPASQEQTPTKSTSTPSCGISLRRQMADIESLARRGIENNGSESDHVIQRTIQELRDLGGQSGIENSAMRLITAHTSITSHLTHQTRTLQSLIHPLLFSPFPLLSEDAIDSLMPLIDEGLLPNLPYPLPEQSQSRRDSRPSTPLTTSSFNPLVSLQALISQTSDITHSLRGLSDTLYESRQLTATASRRLRSARELVADLRREEESREEGSRWIEVGEWDRRLKDREASQECRDVVSGFEAVCGEWREKLFGAGAEVAAA
ncbi:hypothetical protein N7509_003514 [Penicillium cosmopolitanum]|uniref:Uncharacterized protein n=1 Tax=Penicillium cosmopolitanum TaxID=1131564 RepID=A0A9W9W5G0_9EURO|nr:uncharacterized protein N7509_003514 [Penicillium cosmopolitanum]KAJ5403643.1 hypothetical protein N7509_003514 [Penicillium cosmopolitanum]